MYPWAMVFGYVTLTALATDSGESDDGPVVDIVGHPSCTKCHVVLTPMVTIADSGTPVELARSNVFQVDSRGRVYLYREDVDPGELLVLGGDGAVIHTIGRVGAGPGEYRSMDLVISKGDTVHIFDVRNARHTVLSPKYDVVRMRPMGGMMFQPQFIRSDRWAFVGDIGTPLRGRDCQCTR